jgi:cell division septum initiation protein DivIVA
MKNTTAYIDLLEVNINKLIDKQKSLKADNEDLKVEIKTTKNQQKALFNEIERLQKENQTLKNANAILGSTEFKRETKLKINSLIKEIDQCIVQLAE